MRSQPMRNVTPREERKDEEPKTSYWKAFVAIALLSVLLIGAGAYQSWKNQHTIEENRYNGFDFALADGDIWVTRIQGGAQLYDIPFYHHPRELTDIIVRDHDAADVLILANRTVKQVYISVDPDAGAQVAAIGGVEIAKITGERYQLLKVPTTGALSRKANTTADYPVLTCANATAQNVIIQFAQDPEANAIVRDGNCVILFYKTPEDAVRVADRYAFMLLRIMP